MGEAVAVLHCLQRLAGCPLMAETLMAASNFLARIFAALACGQEHVVMESYRLLTRLYAPAAGRQGACPWALPKGWRENSERTARGDGWSAENSAHDNIVARAAKTLSFNAMVLQERCAAGAGGYETEGRVFPGVLWWYFRSFHGSDSTRIDAQRDGAYRMGPGAGFCGVGWGPLDSRGI